MTSPIAIPATPIAIHVARPGRRSGGGSIVVGASNTDSGGAALGGDGAGICSSTIDCAASAGSRTIDGSLAIA